MSDKFFMSSIEFEKAKEYWFEKLGGELNGLQLPIEFTGILQEEKIGIDFNFEKDTICKLFKLSKNQDLSLYVVLLTILKVLLYKYTGQKDIMIGAPPYSDDKDIFNYNKCIVLRDVLNEKMTFKEVLMEVRETVLNGYNAQFYPMNKVFELLSIDEKELLPFKTILLLENIHDKDILKDIIYSSQNDITVSIKKLQDNLQVHALFNPKVFNNSTIEYFFKYYDRLTNIVLSNLNIRIKDIELINEDEKDNVISIFNKTDVKYLENMTIEKIFEQQVVRCPENIAVHFNNCDYTYNEINIKANQLARKLINSGIKKGSIVAIMLDRCPEMLISMLAVLKAGAAYLPIDSFLPKERIIYMLEECKTKVLLTSMNLVKDIDFNLHCIDVINKEVYQGDFLNLYTDNSQNDLAYVIYTSGSSGTPKGVMLEHKGILSLKEVFEKELYVNQKDRVAQFAAASFDASVWETFMALLTGASLYIMTNEVIYDYMKFENYLNENNITIITLPPPYIENLNPNNISTLRLLIAAGSLSTGDLVNKWNGRVQFINAYGPTETTICSTIWKCGDKPCYDTVPIGKPIANTRVYILDEHNKVQPPMIKGEICVSGVGLARGYLNQPRLTEEKFTSDFTPIEERLYRTGDMGRFLPDGTIQFLGRNDNQVKIRGYRIELSEIEKNLLNLSFIKQAVVTINKNKKEDQYLCAYVVVQDEMITEDEIKVLLSKQIPVYMMPEYILKVKSMPLTQSGKVDKKALLQFVKYIDVDQEYVEPCSEIEKSIADIWKEILDVDKVSANSNFFKLGGQSLKAAMLITRISKEFNIALPITKIFEVPILKDLAKYIQDSNKVFNHSIEPAVEKEYYDVSSAQKRIYFVNQIKKNTTVYNMPGIMKIRGNLDVKKLEDVFKKIIMRQDILRTSFVIIEDKPMQYISKDVDFSIEFIDKNNMGKNEPYLNDTEIKNIINEFIEPFDLSKAPLMRLTLVKLSSQEYLMIFDMHHIISDGLSMEIFINEFVNLYSDKELPESSIKYKDFSEWQNRLLESEEMNEQEKYWLDYLKGYDKPIELPTDFETAFESDFEGETLYFNIDSDISKKLNNLALETGATLYMIILSAYNILLQKYTGYEDIVIGAPVAGRPHGDLEKVMGMFVNMIALRNYPKKDKNYKVFLDEVKENALRSYENQNYQFDKLVNKLCGINRYSSRHPLFNTVLTLQNNSIKEIKIPELTFESYNLGENVSKFDLTYIVFDDADKLRFAIEYNINLFKKDSILRMGENFSLILKAITDNADIKIKDIKLEANYKKHKNILSEKFQLNF